MSQVNAGLSFDMSSFVSVTLTQFELHPYRVLTCTIGYVYGFDVLS